MSDTGPDEISVAPQPDDTGHHLGARFDPSTQRLPSAAGAEPADWSDYEPAFGRIREVLARVGRHDHCRQTDYNMGVIAQRHQAAPVPGL